MTTQSASDLSFIGTHDIPNVGKFTVYLTDAGWCSHMLSEEGEIIGASLGPFPTAEGAYLAACSE